MTNVHLAMKGSQSPSFGWDADQRPMRTARWKRVAMWFGLVSATALVTTVVASVITPGLPYRAVRLVQRQFAPRPPVSSSIVDEYVKETRGAEFWDRRPTIFPPSVEYFRTHFAAFDPRHEHPYRQTNFHLWVPDLVHAAPLFAGHPVEVAGAIRDLNILGPPMPNGRIEWIVQLGGVTVEDSGLVYCRSTERIGRQLHAGQIVTASGLVLGTGPIRLANGRLSQATYMACEAIHRPKGQFGRFATYLERHPRAWARLYKRLQTD
jgi:hypothetical protein